MGCLVVNEEFRVNIIKGWGGVLALAEDCTTIYIMEKYIEFIRLVGIPAVVVKNVWKLLATHLIGNSNRFSACIGGSKNWGRFIIWR